MKMLFVALAWIAVAFAQATGKANAGPEVTAPTFLHRIEPEYTAEARAKGLEGIITLYAEVTRGGTTANIRVLKSLDPGLDAKAIAAVKQWRFHPARRDGKAVTVAATIEVEFRLPRYTVLPSDAPRPEVASEDDDGLGILELLRLIPPVRTE
jgi:protein TonB